MNSFQALRDEIRGPHKIEDFEGVKKNRRFVSYRLKPDTELKTPEQEQAV